MTHNFRQRNFYVRTAGFPEASAVMFYPISEFPFMESISTFLIRPKKEEVTREWRKLHN